MIILNILKIIKSVVKASNNIISKFNFKNTNRGGKKCIDVRVTLTL